MIKIFSQIVGESGVDIFIKRKIEYCMIHSYFANKGFAPMIYDFGSAHGYNYVEVDDVSGKNNDVVITADMVIKECKNSGFIIPHMIEFRHPERSNFINGYYIDFHGFKIDWDKFNGWFRENIKDSHWGLYNKQGKYSYQANDIVEGKRRLNQRISEMKLKKEHVFGKTVIDFGCNLGVMSLWARENGASSVTGIECFPNFKLMADIYKFYKLVDKVNFIEDVVDPKNIDKYGKYDIVFYFAVEASLGIPNKLKNITNEILIYECHSMKDVPRVENRLKELFEKVELVGYTTDRTKRPVYYCYK